MKCVRLGICSLALSACAGPGLTSSPPKLLTTFIYASCEQAEHGGQKADSEILSDCLDRALNGNHRAYFMKTFTSAWQAKKLNARHAHDYLVQAVHWGDVKLMSFLYEQGARLLYDNIDLSKATTYDMRSFKLGRVVK